MLSIKVLGPGCASCQLLKQQAVAALEELAEETPSLVEATIQHVTAYDEIMRYRVLATPALVVNERVVCAGRIPSVADVTVWLREALDGAGKEG